MKHLLGIDIGTSSVKASLVEASTGLTIASAQYPDNEAPILSVHPGWAEQEPEMWWQELKEALRRLESKAAGALAETIAIGISYQMHGLVCVDKTNKVLRPSIIWCDGRASKYGGKRYGNFTAAKLAWVKNEEPDIYRQIHKVMLPGDYIAMRLSGGDINTTASGLSEGMFWNLKDDCLDKDTMEYFGFPETLIPDVKPTFSVQSSVCKAVAAETGLPAGTPISYRAGDQPNNALSLNVVRPGEIAATGGTSGVVYGVTDRFISDGLNRVNVFKHVQHLGVLLCINGTGILNAWIRKNIAPEGLSYNEMNTLAESVPVGAEGLSIIPFGNGAERVLENRDPGASVHGINFNIHTRAHMMRAAQEGIAFSFAYGIDIMRQMGMEISTIKAGHANMFLSPLFCRTLAAVANARIELYETDGSVGAAYGAGIGAGIYHDSDEAFKTLKHIGTIMPENDTTAYISAYELWKKRLNA